MVRSSPAPTGARLLFPAHVKRLADGKSDDVVRRPPIMPVLGQKRPAIEKCQCGPPQASRVPFPSGRYHDRAALGGTTPVPLARIWPAVPEVSVPRKIHLWCRYLKNRPHGEAMQRLSPPAAPLPLYPWDVPIVPILWLTCLACALFDSLFFFLPRPRPAGFAYRAASPGLCPGAGGLPAQPNRPTPIRGRRGGMARRDAPSRPSATPSHDLQKHALPTPQPWARLRPARSRRAAWNVGHLGDGLRGRAIAGMNCVPRPRTTAMIGPTDVRRPFYPVGTAGRPTRW